MRLKLSVLAAVAGAILALILFLSLPVNAQQQVRDCDNNAMIRCGALSITELKQKYMQNVGNLQLVYQQFDIIGSKDLDGMVVGVVNTDNQVLVAGKVIATNAVTAGRVNMPGSVAIAGGVFKRPPSVSFANKPGSLVAFVQMINGRFKFAVIMSCGNPVKATPVPPPTPKPTPQSTPTPLPPAPVTTISTPPKTLANTGAGNYLGLFMAISGTAAGGYNFFLRIRKRLS